MRRALLILFLPSLAVAQTGVSLPRSVICDKGAECATVTGGKLDVNASVTVPDVSVAVFADPSGNTTVHRLDADGKVQIAGTINASSSANATAAAPSYSEGQAEAFSQTLAGRLRTITQVDPAVTSTIAVSNFPASQAVTGTFWQATQPVSGTLTCNAGTGTLAVSGPLTDTELRATAVPVSGTFWQATQPVSGTVTASVDPARATSVVGTFWQATQPVSGTVTANAGTGTMAVSGPLTDAQLRATPVPVSGTVTVTDGAGALNVIVDSGTVAISQTTTANDVDVASIAAGDNNIGNVDVVTLPNVTIGTFPDNEPFNVAQVGGTATTADNAAAGATNVHTLPAVVETSTTLPARTDGNRAALLVDGDGKLYVRTHDSDQLSVTSGLSTATTLTQLIAAPGASVSIYITGVTFSASVAATTTTDQQATLKYGTGSNCGTGTTYLWGAFNPANGGAVAQFAQPIKVAANNALCWIHAAAGSKIVQVSYFLAP